MAKRHSDVVSPALSPASFIAALPPPRRAEFERVRNVLRRGMPSGYEEVIIQNMLVYQVPLSRYRDTYNGRPLWYAALASQKSYLSLHLMPIYASPVLQKQLTDGFRAAGKKLDMGKACVRFQSADDLPLDVIEDIVAKIQVDRWIEIARSARR
jgi:hypothetical protein